MTENWIKHYSVLRKTFLKILAVWLALFIVLAFKATVCYDYFAKPLINHLPFQHALIATSLTAPLMTPLKFSFFLSVLFIIPYLCYMLWRFVAPGLYREERKLLLFFVGLSISLFYLGVIFAYEIVMPAVFKFIVKITPESVLLLPDLDKYFAFSLKMLLSFGLAFQAPVIILALLLSGAVSLQSLSKARPMVIIGAFVIGMLLTPPDVVSQILLAIPLCLLFEMSLLLARFLKLFKPTNTVPQP